MSIICWWNEKTIALRIAQGRGVTEVSSHAAECPRCAAVMNEFQRLATGLAGLAEPGLDENRFQQAVFARMAAQPVRRSTRFRTLYAAALAAASLAIAALMLRTPSHSTQPTAVASFPQRVRERSVQVASDIPG